MSGGSYDYFYSRVTEMLERIRNPLECMLADDRSEWSREKNKYVKTGLAIPPGSARMQLELALFHLKYAETILERGDIRDVLHAVEWYKSGDSFADHIDEACAKVGR